MYIVEETVYKAWLAGASHLLKQKSLTDFNVVLRINSPAQVTKGDLEIHKEIDALLKKADKSLQTVAETIFPAWEYQTQKSKGVFKVYPEEVYPKIKRVNKWGTYAYRLVRQKGSDGKLINPLEGVVNRMKAELKRGKKRAAYELSLTDLSEEIAIHDNAVDPKYAIGGPCLSHLSFKLDPEKKKVHLAVMYRSHYYMERVLGNLVGLARLQDFVAKETGMSCGELLCVSTYAKLDLKKDAWTKKDVDTLLKKFSKKVK